MKDEICLKKNNIYQTIITGYSSDGLGICHINGCAVFVHGAILGESVAVKIVKVLKNSAFGIVDKYLEVSKERIEPECPYYKYCGGCSMLHMSYAEELRFKLDRVNNALFRIGGQNLTVSDIIPCNMRTGYRNKVTFSIGYDGNKAFFGFYSARSHRVVSVDNCLINDPRACYIAKVIVDFMNLHQLLPYDESSGEGTVRHINIRNSIRKNDICVCITVAHGLGIYTETLKKCLIEKCPYISGIILNVNRKPGNELLIGDFYTLFGNQDIRDNLCGFEFRIAPKSFYQINPPQAEKLYQLAIDFITPSPEETVLDVYCGIGTITLLLSRYFKEAIGIEVVSDAIENARFNTEKNNITNAEFICADASQALDIFVKNGTRVDAVVVDPPRKGMNEDAIYSICAMTPSRVVYVSCNPSTLARDIRTFNSLGYVLNKAACVDMFPGTTHIETIVLLQRENS